MKQLVEPIAAISRQSRDERIAGKSLTTRRWFVRGSPALKQVVLDAFREFGVSVYTQPEVPPGGELSQLYDRAPGFRIIDYVIYHTTLDTAAMVPAGGRSRRAPSSRSSIR